MSKKNYEWHRLFFDGIFQFVFENEDGDIVKTKYDVSDGKCREVWKLILHDFPYVKGYREYCDCYNYAKEEWRAYWKRDTARYNAFWNYRK